MSTDSGSSASNESTGSADDSTGSNQIQAIKPEDHLRALDDLKKFKGRSRELEAQLANLQGEIESIRTQKLSESNDFKTLYEQAKAKNSDWEARYGKLKENVVYNEKYKAAQKALIEAGLRKDALKILDKDDLDSIVVEHTSEGRMLVSGVEEYVDSFKKTYGFAFEDKTKARVNGGGGHDVAMNSGMLTPQDVIAIERKHGINSKEYKAAYEQYTKQRNR